MIGVIDYGLGNIKSFLNVFDRLNIASKVIKINSDFENVTKLILPGVGAFDYAMSQLNNSGLRERLEKSVRIENIPVLGICVGMQMLANSSDEGVLPGLGWIDGKVKKIDTNNIFHKTKIPHMGWNNTCSLKDNILMRGFNDSSIFYFLHSYYFECDNDINSIASTFYGKKFTCAVNDKNVYGVQFHPEKSHQNGINLLNNFSLI